MSQEDGLVLLNPDQYDMNNETQATDFLSQLLDDSVLQYNAQDFSRYFWYGIVAVIGLFSLFNILSKLYHVSR